MCSQTIERRGGTGVINIKQIFGRVGVVALCGLGMIGSSAVAHQTSGTPFEHTHTGERFVVTGEIYQPGIWVDPDGCEHWVMDDGWEGYMTPKTDRQGRPSCPGRQQNVCGVMSSDTLFATDSYHLSHRAQQHLRNFFASNRANGYIITGHTDSRASDAYNMRLSMNRARSVARVAQGTGARVVDVRGAGERSPIATNSTREGMSRNRRVEIICVN